MLFGCPSDPLLDPAIEAVYYYYNTYLFAEWVGIMPQTKYRLTCESMRGDINTSSNRLP